MVSRRSCRRWAILAASWAMASIVVSSALGSADKEARALLRYTSSSYGVRPGMLRFGRTLVPVAETPHGAGDGVGEEILDRLGQDDGKFGRKAPRSSPAACADRPPPRPSPTRRCAVD